MVLKMFSKQTIFSLVDILFKDMYEDSKLVEEEAKPADDEQSSRENEK
jgi:hypothetical protein